LLTVSNGPKSCWLPGSFKSIKRNNSRTIWTIPVELNRTERFWSKRACRHLNFQFQSKALSSCVSLQLSHCALPAIKNCCAVLRSGRNWLVSAAGGWEGVDEVSWGCCVGLW
jgi:hypothetical protein